MITKKIIAPLFVVILLSGIAGIATAQRAAQRRATTTRQLAAYHGSESGAAETTLPESMPTRKGYVPYDSSRVSSGVYKHTVLFFSSNSCSQCQAYEAAITSDNIPGDVQFLKVDYDTTADLKNKYTINSWPTFIRVDTRGTEQKKWVGQGKDKSVKTILRNLGIQ